MTVKASPRDNDGALLQANLTALQALQTKTGSTAHAAFIAAQVDQAQRELVHHYLDVGRINAATILSTLT